MKKIFLAVVMLAIAIVIFAHRSEFLQLLAEIEEEKTMSPIATAVTLIVLKTLAAPLGFPGTPLTLLTGSLFGYFFGTLISLIGNTLGACLAFLLSRYVLHDYVQKKLFSRYPKIKKYEQKIARNGFKAVVILRLIPLFPFNALNFLLGVSNISFKQYAGGSFVGMIPGTFLFVYFGESLRMLMLANIILALAGIIMLTYLGRLYEKSDGVCEG